MRGNSCWNKVTFLNVGPDRLEQWCVLGYLCIGEAIHTMSSVGGVGIDLALHDTVVTNLLEKPLRRAQADPHRLGRMLNSAFLDLVLLDSASFTCVGAEPQAQASEPGATLWTMSKVRPSVRRLFANVPVEWSNGWILHRPGVDLCRGSTTQAPVQRGRCEETVQVSAVKTLPNHRGAHQKSATVALAGCRRRCGRCRGPDQEQ